MAWFEILNMLMCFFCCLGMAQQQEPDFMDRWKRNTNIIYSLFNIHQRAVVVPIRNRWGTQALGAPCAFALLLMLGWWTVTADDGMFYWMCGWCVFFVVRRAEAVRLSGQVDSRYDGHPQGLGTNERMAKLFLEPIGLFILAMAAFAFYQEQGLSPKGLPYFLICSVVTLPFVASVNQTIWDNKLRDMRDAERENAALRRDYRDKFGD